MPVAELPYGDFNGSRAFVELWPSSRDKETDNDKR